MISASRARSEETWCDGFAPLTEFSSSVEQPPFDKLWVIQGGRESEFKLGKTARGLPIFRGPGGGGRR